MQKTFLIALILLFSTINVSYAEKIHNARDYAERNTKFIYVLEDVYKFYVTLERVTEIRLQPGENFITMYGGNTEGLLMEQATTKNDNGSIQNSLFVKPTRSKIDTNAVIITDKRMYKLLISSDEIYYNPVVMWQYPLDEYYSQQKALAKLQEEFSIIPALNSLNGYMQYEFICQTQSPTWKPLYAFEYAGKLYIKLPEAVKTNEMPIVFALKNDKPQLVNYRIRQNHFIVDKIAKELLLINGDEQILVRKIEVVEKNDIKQIKKRKTKNE